MGETSGTFGHDVVHSECPTSFLFPNLLSNASEPKGSGKSSCWFEEMTPGFSFKSTLGGGGGGVFLALLFFPWLGESVGGDSTDNSEIRGDLAGEVVDFEPDGRMGRGGAETKGRGGRGGGAVGDWGLTDNIDS